LPILGLPFARPQTSSQFTEKLAPLHSITSSAWPTNVAGSARSSVLAVFNQLRPVRFGKASWDCRTCSTPGYRFRHGCRVDWDGWMAWCSP